MRIPKETIDSVRSAKAAAMKDYEKLGERFLELKKLLEASWPNVEFGAENCCMAMYCYYHIDPDDQEKLHCPLHIVLKKHQ